MLKSSTMALASCLTLISAGAFAQPLTSDQMKITGSMEELSPEKGAMITVMPDGKAGSEDRLVFEPFQMADELAEREDLVFLMRHGPTDWSKRDEKNVAPTDCDNQRVMTPEGRKSMEELGTVLGANLLFPAKVIVSEWCRNQQTLESLRVGFDKVADNLSDSFVIETDPSLNLLLSLQGAPDVKALRETITAWDGAKFKDSEYEGRLLIITHFTNIEELTNFAVFEGEILVVDPKRENRVIGYLRLDSAAPDVGHFVQ